jgi:hypothetical protein
LNGYQVGGILIAKLPAGRLMERVNQLGFNSGVNHNLIQEEA